MSRPAVNNTLRISWDCRRDSIKQGIFFTETQQTDCYSGDYVVLLQSEGTRPTLSQEVVQDYSLSILTFTSFMENFSVVCLTPDSY